MSGCVVGILGGEVLLEWGFELDWVMLPGWERETGTGMRDE